MSDIKAYLYSHDPQHCSADKWDYGIIREAFERKGIEQVRVEKLPVVERGFVVIPGPQNAGCEVEVSNELKNISRVVLFVNGDEHATFDIDKINHPNIEIWVQYPQKNKHEKYNKLAQGSPQHIKNNIPDYPIKDCDVYFAGQINHKRRRDLGEVMEGIEHALYKPTAGFTKGDKPKEYYRLLSKTKIAPCPSGVVCIDSFRFYEAIEMMAFPVADRVNPKGVQQDYYEYLFNDDVNNMVSVASWYELNSVIPTVLKNWPNNMHRLVCWWLKYKRDFANKIMSQVNA